MATARRDTAPAHAVSPARFPAGLAGLVELAARINDVLMSMGTQPAFSGPSQAQQSAIEASPPVRRARPSSGSRPRPLRPAPDPGPDAGPGSTPPGEDDDVVGHEEMDETHAETWRLVELAQGGDGDAFGRLYDRYVDMVFRFIYFRVNDRALAEDFTSETFLRALRRITSISYQGRDIGAWFITIARNIVLDHMKSARHRLESPTADTIETRDHHERSTESAVLDTLQAEQLMAAVNRLGDEQRECVMLRFIQGLSVAETAQIMGKNDGAIKALQHRAVRKLADLVGGDIR